MERNRKIGARERLARSQSPRRGRIGRDPAAGHSVTMLHNRLPSLPRARGREGRGRGGWRRRARRRAGGAPRLGAAEISGHDRGGASAPAVREARLLDLRYEAPQTLEAAVALLAGASGTTRLLAGGTDVIVQMETDLIEPQLLVDIKKIAQLREIVAENGGFRVGAAVPGVELLNHAAFCKAWPGVIEGVKLIGSIQVKGRASMGGNLCNASPAADSVPALVAAGAIARIVGSQGAREVPVEKVPVAPGKTSLAKDEIVASFLFPP